MGIIYKNDAIRINFNIGISTASTLDIKLNYRKPVVDYPNQSEVGVFETVEVEGAETGDCYVEIGNDIITPEGSWTFWSEVEVIGGDVFSGDPFTHDIHPRGVAITNKDFVKSYLGITDNLKDAKIEALIPLYEQLYLDIRNAPWAQRYDETNERLFNQYPSGADVTIAQMIGYKISQGASYDVLTSEHIGSYSWTSDGKTSYGFPSGIISQIKRFINGV